MTRVIQKVAATRPDPSAVWMALDALTDPEIPVLSLREMGILREVRFLPDAGDGAYGVEVVITPTYSGCPAIDQIKEDIRTTLAALRIDAKVIVQWAPAWTTDGLSEVARAKLRDYGIAPPGAAAPTAASPTGFGAAPDAGKPIPLSRKAAHVRAQLPVPCPRCGSSDTTETSHFGSTACKALFRCLACMEPFDHFKPH